MRTPAPMCVVFAVLMLPAFSQPGAAPQPPAALEAEPTPEAAKPPPPPPVPATAPIPAAPAGPPGQPWPPQPNAVGSPPGEPHDGLLLLNDTEAYPDWVHQEFPAFTHEFLGAHPEIMTVLFVARLLHRPLLFLALFLLVGLVCGGLARRIIAPQPDDGIRRDGKQPDRSKRLAAWSLVVWIGALAVASEAVGLHWFVAILGTLGTIVSAVVTGVVWLVIGGAIVYAATTRGRGLLLSLIGWYYIQYHPNKPAEGHEFDLGDGKTGRVEKVDPLHTTFDIGDGAKETRPNSWLMKTHFGWGESGAAGKEPGAGDGN